MCHFLLPKTLSNSMLEETTEPITLSLPHYISSFPLQHHSVSLSDLLSLYSIPEGTIYTGQSQGDYSIILDTSDSFSLDILKYQSLHGYYISKVSTTSSAEAIQYLYKLSSSYSKVYICKPEHDCPTSSTKYIVASNYLQIPEKGNLKIPYYFRMKLEDINSILGQIQLEHLRFKGIPLGKNINE
jgi:hypothetical protein